MNAYYNENDPYAADWLENLIAAGHLPAGDVDRRSILDVQSDDLKGYGPCHFFAGIGGWPYAGRLAGLPDDFSWWSGSCPCQPLSGAGLRKGHADERHLWPAFYRLIAERRPATILGEQVASKDGREWLAAIRADLEGIGYAVGAADLCSASVGAPHIRQRLGFVAHANQRIGAQGRALDGGRYQRGNAVEGAGFGRDDGPSFVAHADDPRPQGWSERGNGADQRLAGADSMAGRLADAERDGRRGCGLGSPEPTTGGMQAANGQRERLRLDARPSGAVDDGSFRPSPVDGFWRDADWLFCRDDKWRPVEARIQQMVDGIPVRMGRLRADLAEETEKLIAQAAKGRRTTRDEILREVREAIGNPLLFGEAGNAVDTQQAQILLSYLLEHTRQERKEPNTTDGSSEGGGPRRELRLLWRQGSARNSSCERGLDGWPPEEFADAVRLLSSAVARFAQEAGYPVLYADAPASSPLTGPQGHGSDIGSDRVGKLRPSRVGRLRAYGNAITPQVWAEFIRACAEC